MAAEEARERLARGVKLNHSEAIALIIGAVVARAHDGRSVASMMEAGARVMICDQCMGCFVDHTGTYQVDAGLSGGRTHKIGKAGNVDSQSDKAIAIGSGV